LINENLQKGTEISSLEAKFIESIEGIIYFIGLKSFTTIKKKASSPKRSYSVVACGHL
jgi:hypothetical protein